MLWKVPLPFYRLWSLQVTTLQVCDKRGFLFLAQPLQVWLGLLMLLLLIISFSFFFFSFWQHPVPRNFASISHICKGEWSGKYHHLFWIFLPRSFFPYYYFFNDCEVSSYSPSFIPDIGNLGLLIFLVLGYFSRDLSVLSTFSNDQFGFFWFPPIFMFSLVSLEHFIWFHFMSSLHINYT